MRQAMSFRFANITHKAHPKIEIGDLEYSGLDWDPMRSRKMVLSQDIFRRARAKARWMGAP
jgi:hypothetical protein